MTVQEREDGRIEIRYKGKVRPYREIAAPEPPAVKLVDKPARRSGWKPPASHPWKVGRGALRQATASAAP